MANDVNYFEIGSSDPEASKAFYGPLFGWEFGEPAMPARYGTVNDNRGGLWDTTEIGADNSAIFYVQVDDVQAVLHRAQELGATVPYSSPSWTTVRSSSPRSPTRSGPTGVWRRKIIE